MKYNVWIYDCEDVLDVDEAETSVIRLESIDQDVLEYLTKTFEAQGINICAFPYCEG